MHPSFETTARKGNGRSGTPSAHRSSTHRDHTRGRSQKQYLMPRGEVRIGPGVRGCIGNKHHLCAALATTHVPMSSTRLALPHSASPADESPCPALLNRPTWISGPVVRRRSIGHATVRSRPCPSSIRQDSTSRRGHDRILRLLKPPTAAKFRLPLQRHTSGLDMRLKFHLPRDCRQKIHYGVFIQGSFD